jgi:hypothetical protein
MDKMHRGSFVELPLAGFAARRLVGRPVERVRSLGVGKWSQRRPQTALWCIFTPVWPISLPAGVTSASVAATVQALAGPGRQCEHRDSLQVDSDDKQIGTGHGQNMSLLATNPIQHAQQVSDGLSAHPSKEP